MMINFSASSLLLIFLLVSTGLMEQGEAQGCAWECKHLPKFPCWLGDVGKGLCNDLCRSEGAESGICVTNPSACLCRKPGCS